MSVANILGVDGKIKELYLPAAAPAPSVTNPLTANLDCSGFEVTAASYVRTDVVECETLEAKAPQTFIECVDDLQMGVGAEIRSELVVADQLQVREGAGSASLTYAAGFNELKLRPADNAGGGSVSIQQGGGAQPTLNFFDISNSRFGNIRLGGAQAITTDSTLIVARANPSLSLVDTSGTVIQANINFFRTGPTAGVLLTNQNLTIASPVGEIGIQRISVQPAAAGKFILGGLTVTNTLPTFPNDSFITLNIGGVDYQLALKRA